MNAVLRAANLILLYVSYRPDRTLNKALECFVYELAREMEKEKIPARKQEQAFQHLAEVATQEAKRIGA